MGVLNITPDSFSDGGHFLDPVKAEEQALRLESEGAHILDLGAESSRPGAERLSWKEEWRRLRPVLKRIRPKVQIPISVDTYKPEVARAALELGAEIINDIFGFRSKSLARVVARYQASVVLMHIQGTPKTMQKKPIYGGVTQEVCMALKRSVENALEAGIPKNRILVDPGFGFGKTPQHNLDLLRGLPDLGALKMPVLVGLSRKSFLGYYSGVERPSERLAGSLGSAAAAVLGGAHVVRVHDVKPHSEMLGILDQVLRNK